MIGHVCSHGHVTGRSHLILCVLTVTCVLTITCTSDEQVHHIIHNGAIKLLGFPVLLWCTWHRKTVLYPPLAENVLNIGCHIFTTSVGVQHMQPFTCLGFSPRQEFLQCCRKLTFCL